VQPLALPGDRTEYIMMRGPKGKGQCQVAISSLKSSALEPTTQEGESFPANSDSNSSLSSSDKKFKGLTDRLKYVAGAVKSIMGVDKKQESSEISALMASITYVNIAWGSIVNDLLEYAKQRAEGVD
jgi:flagellar hook-length control protein FliK